MKRKKNLTSRRVTLPNRGDVLIEKTTNKFVNVLDITESLGIYHILGSYDNDHHVHVFKPEELSTEFNQ